MRKQILIIGALALLLCGAGFSAAQEDVSFSEGTVSVGGYYTDYSDNPGRVGEYSNLLGMKDPMADLQMGLFGGTENVLYRLDMNYHDDKTKSLDFGLDSQSLLSMDFSYGSFVHNLDHDYMENLMAREIVPGGAPGGKQVYHTDNDPLGRYFMEYENFRGDLSLDLPFVADGEVSFGMVDQHKRGYKQAMSIDHCAFCHIESGAQRVDQQTQIWKAGVRVSDKAVTVTYDFAKTRFIDRADDLNHTWKSAIHPVSGLPFDFGSRMAFSDVTLPYAQAADSDKYSHNVGLKLDLKTKGMLKGSYTNTNRTSYQTGVESQFDAGAFGYAVRLNKKTRLTAKYLRYETKVDDFFVDLPAYRDGLGAGSLDFDWNRISSANRKVNQGDLNLSYKVAKGKHLKVNWRYQIIDRPAMSQTQTNYIFDDTGGLDANIVEDLTSEAFENKTKVNRIKLRYDSRMGLKGNYNLTYTFTGVDKPFMNPTAMCEESIAGIGSTHGTAGTVGRIYYFQRERWGNGTNMPSLSHKVTARGSYQVSPRASVSGYVTYAKDKNDEMNLYEYDRDMLSPGINLWTAPKDNLLFTLGWNHNKVTSNANLCIPVFDG